MCSYIYRNEVIELLRLGIIAATESVNLFCVFIRIFFISVQDGGIYYKITTHCKRDRTDFTTPPPPLMIGTNNLCGNYQIILSSRFFQNSQMTQKWKALKCCFALIGLISAQNTYFQLFYSVILVLFKCCNFFKTRTNWIMKKQWHICFEIVEIL
jgi:hypothetical protein